MYVRVGSSPISRINKKEMLVMAFPFFVSFAGRVLFIQFADGDYSLSIE